MAYFNTTGKKIRWLLLIFIILYTPAWYFLARHYSMLNPNFVRVLTPAFLDSGYLLIPAFFMFMVALHQFISILNGGEGFRITRFFMNLIILPLFIAVSAPLIFSTFIIFSIMAMRVWHDSRLRLNTYYFGFSLNLVILSLAPLTYIGFKLHEAPHAFMYYSEYIVLLSALFILGLGWSVLFGLLRYWKKAADRTWSNLYGETEIPTDFDWSDEHF